MKRNVFVERIAQAIYDGKWIDADHFTKMHFRIKATQVFGALNDPPQEFIDAFNGDNPVDDFTERWWNAIASTEEGPDAAK